MSVDLEKIKNAKGYLYVNDKRCPEPICVDDYIAYKEIEKELGIDLITLFKALKDGIWHITSNRKVIGYLNVKWNWCIGRDYFKTKYGNFYFKDYGKTWALTEKELL